MPKKTPESTRCRNDIEKITRFYEAIPSAVERILDSCKGDDCFHHLEPTPIPTQESAVEIIQQARRILFPGYFTRHRLDHSNLAYNLGQETTELFERLSKEVILSVKHDCLRYDQICSVCTERGHDTALKFIQALPELRAVLATDIRAALEGDPAAKSYDEVISCYPGLFAMTVYRMAHKLHDLDVPLLPRMMTEYAHSLTGIDIHPGAEIGESFFIDHGTGIVVGETTEIGKRVRIYQGVTLGALSLPRDAGDRYRNKKRHPTIEDDVIIYSNATILGGETVIGARTVIGGNVWITKSVPADTKVILRQPELLFAENKNTKPTIIVT